MIPDFTRQQLDSLKIAPDRPLLICDVDEVVVHFTRSFEDYIGKRSLYLETTSFALNGNVRRLGTAESLDEAFLSDLIDEFFSDCTEHLPPIDGAVEAVNVLAANASVVMLTNLPHHARDKRIRNLLGLGIAFPVITNSGPKGPAIQHLAAQTADTVVFVDDSPGFIASSFEHAPEVHLVHFLHDERFARHLQPLPFVSLTTGTWEDALPHIQGLLG